MAPAYNIRNPWQPATDPFLGRPEDVKGQLLQELALAQSQAGGPFQTGGSYWGGTPAGVPFMGTGRTPTEVMGARAGAGGPSGGSVMNPQLAALASGQSPLSTQFAWQTNPLMGGSNPTANQLAGSKNAWGVQMWKTPVGGATQEDALQAMLGDRAVAEQKIGQMEADRQAGIDTALGMGGRAQDLRDVAGLQRAGMRADLGEAKTKGREAVAKAGESVAALGPAAEARRQEALREAASWRQENLADAETRKTEALVQFKDDSAALVQTQRGAAMSQFYQTRDDIINGAAQRGLSPDHPEVQKQLNRAKMDTFRQLGNTATQAQLAYNDSRSKLTAAYDDFGMRARAFSDQLATTVRLEEDKYVGLSQQQMGELGTRIAELTSSMELAAAQEARAQEQQVSNLLVAADQLELAGSQTVADYMRSYQIAMAPLAPIVSLAAQLNMDATLANQQSVAAVSSGVGAQVPGSPIRYTAGSGQTTYPGLGGTQGYASDPYAGLRSQVAGAFENRPASLSASGQPSTASGGGVGLSPVQRALSGYAVT